MIRKTITLILIAFYAHTFFGCEEQNCDELKITLDQLQNENNNQKIVIDKLQKTLEERNVVDYRVRRRPRSFENKDTLLILGAFKNFIIDFDIINKIPKPILDSLKLNYPDYYIPTAKRCSEKGVGSFKISEHPFFIKGDFNDDGEEDYAFYLESYKLNYSQYWTQNHQIVLLYTYRFPGSDDIVYKSFEIPQGDGAGQMIHIEKALLKLSRNVTYEFSYTKIEASQSDRILTIFWGGDVGSLLEWDGSEFTEKILWDRT